MNVVFIGEVNNKAVINKMINEDALFASKQSSVSSLSALGAVVDRIEEVNGIKTVYIRKVDNLILG